MSMSQAPSWFEWLFRPEATDARRTGLGDAASMVRKTRRLQRRMRTLTADNDALALQIAQKTASNTHLAATNERLTAQIADAKATLDATNARLDTTNAQSDTRLQEVVSEKARLEGRLRELTTSLSDVHATNVDLAAENARLEGRLRELTTSLSDVHATNVDLAAENARLEGRLRELTTSLSDVHATNVDLAAENARLEARWSEVSATNDTLSTSLGSLTDTFSLWLRNRPDETHHMEPLAGDVVQYVIEDVSQYKTLAVSSQRVVATHDTDVRTFSDADCTYIIMPYRHQNVHQILSITCDSTIIQLCYHLSPYITSVQILTQPTDGTQVIAMNGRNLFTAGNQLLVSSRARQLSTLLALTPLEAGDTSYPSRDAPTALVNENPPSGARLVVRTAASMLDTSDVYVFQLVHGADADSTLSSNPMTVAFVVNPPTFSD
jgi:predicted nuclease with TOPRIM domain